ncbi:hypothetical protein FRACYDRAFT_233237 [Fragilariopsis cylindrus CCMP1102]|uniref:PDZ domain-containing protein n=1 Tax=Fragilariopsis cylindrus CCMP1102 TaxID=635003 RepID=A0A1E7FY42_9STRA|nr:hypothetical protein FRACYDRAFT_233237 [Fragilariopsis cylindrus CCMP1102]|eukprot:OEU23071.1 hypothetical protein FRACYDRAFT_233237 [Fragilariopsis cylindrus CCMP1102]
MNMFPLEFDKFLERGISTIDASVKELQNTYEEVVWGGAPQHTSNTSTSPLRRRNNNNGSSAKQQEILRRSRSGPELSPELLARREDALRSRSRSSSGRQTKTGLHVSAKATTTITPTKSTPRGGLKSPSSNTNNTNTNALTPTTEVDDSSWGDSSSSDGDDTSYGDTTSGFYSTERDNDSSLMESLTTNNTPAKSGGRKSLLIVSAIDSQHGLFAYTSLNVGDAILEINGISFSSNGGYGSLRPSVYRARKLLSGNDSGLEVTIIYQKFGETNNTSMASESTIGLSQMMYDEVEEEKKEEEQQEQQVHGNSTSSGRRSQNNSRTITSKKGVSSPQGPSSSEHSRSERTATTRSMSTRSGSYLGRPQRNIRKAAAAAINAASTTTFTTKDSSGGAAAGANRPPLPSSPRSKAPTTKISRLTRLRARTQKLRETGVKTIEASKKRLSFVSSNNNNNNNSTKNKKQISNKEKETTTTTTMKASASRAAVVTAASKLEKKLKKSSSSSDRRHGDNNDHCTKDEDGSSTSNHNIYDVVGTRSTLPHNIIEACAVGVCAPISPEDSILNLSDDPSIISSSSSIHLNPGIALSSAGDVLYKEQLQWLKQKMKARGSLPPSSTIDHNDIFRGIRTTSPSAVPTTTTTTTERDTKTTHSQQQQNLQLLSPVNNKNNINNEKNAIFDDNSICTIEQYESIVQRYDGGRGGGDITADNHQKELVRINRKVFDKLHGRIDRLKRSNIQLSDQIVSLRRENNNSSAKLSEVQSRSEKICKRERGYQSEIQLLRSRYEMSIIQADKRQKELITSKEEAQKENDKVISDYLKQIESLESANQGQLQIADKERQEKYKVLYSQLEQLETKFSAQSTLLDTVMTANEELTTQNEEMEVEYQKHYHSNSNGSAVEIANCKSRNIYLEKRVANLESQLGLQEGRLLNQESIGISIISEDHSGNNKSSNSNPSDEEMIADQNYVSASTDDSFVEVFVGGNSASGHQQLRYPQRLLRGEPANDNNGCETGTEILLKYPNNGELFDNSIIEEVEDNDDNNTDSIVKGNTVSFESVSSRLLMERIDRIKGNNESFESVSSQVLMERMVELENALQDRDMTEEERVGFVSILQARVQRLIERGYGEYHVSD